MKKLILALAILATSIGFADAHPARHHVARTPWQANAAAMQKASQQRASGYETSVSGDENFSQFNDH
jgi:hypothetical protein